VHTSLSRLGWAGGGPQAVVEALLAAVESEGTIAMPTHSTHLTDPARWSRPPVPESWWEAIRAEGSPYDPALTPTRSMGAVVECFRHVPGVRRSGHPAFSFGAVGPDAARITDGHDLAFGMGEGSPLARLYEADARVLLLGVGHGNNTSLHLAEYRAAYEGKDWIRQGSPMVVDGERRWVTYDDLEPDDSDFGRLGAAFAATGAELRGTVGAGTARLMRQRDVVDFAVTWMEANRRHAHPSA
jgi:aminoglycoside 3-N-acetyltransferase